MVGETVAVLSGSEVVPSESVVVVAAAAAAAAVAATLRGLLLSPLLT